MSRTQTRRSVSLNREIFDAAQAAADRSKVSLSYYLECIVRANLNMPAVMPREVASRSVTRRARRFGTQPRFSVKSEVAEQMDRTGMSRSDLINAMLDRESEAS